MSYVGISCGFHDAALSIIDKNGNISFAAHSERYSKKKHDKNLHKKLIDDAHLDLSQSRSIHYYENSFKKSLRQVRSGENISLKNFFPKNIIGKDMIAYLNVDNIESYDHHLSHCAAGFQTSSFNKATIVVIDAIGEFDTISIWGAEYINDQAKYKKLWTQTYPDSIGLFYSAMTKKIGLRPLDEEYILMGMAAWGLPKYTNYLYEYFIKDIENLKFNYNLHTGINDNILTDADPMDIASSTQMLVEILINVVMKKAAAFSWSKNLVYMGGVALNCLANAHLGKYFDNIWIMPNPGDAGSSLGAAALGYGKRINWTNAYLGYDIKNDYPVDDLLKHLLMEQIAGVACQKAEFGPRALGNRSLLADPRGPEIKDKVNTIKKRQKFRPFAPVILEEHVNDFFEMPKNWKNSRYMQVVAKCYIPNEFPAIIHVDGTSRVQTVPKDNSGIRLLLEQWYKKTSCPLLLNTSLNIRNEPMVNDIADAQRFQTLYNTKVFSG